MFELPLFVQSHSLVTYLLKNNRELFLEKFPKASDYSPIHLTKIKTKGLFVLYEIKSENGFVPWQISNELFNEGLPIEGKRIPSHIRCVKAISPNNVR